MLRVRACGRSPHAAFGRMCGWAPEVHGHHAGPYLVRLFHVIFLARFAIRPASMLQVSAALITDMPAWSAVQQGGSSAMRPCCAATMGSPAAEPYQRQSVGPSSAGGFMNRTDGPAL